MSNFLELIKLAGCKEPKDTGNFWRTNAVWRGGNGYNVSINKETGYWKDYVTLDSGPFTKFCQLCGISKEVQHNPEKEKVEELKRIDYKRYPKECLDKLKKDYSFYTKRNISTETLEHFGCGLATSGKFFNRMCFPIFDKEGAIMGFAGRKIEEYETDRPKWLIHGPKRRFLYPAHINDFVLKVKQEVVLVESVGDVLALWEIGIRHTLCLFGLDISAKLMAYLLEISPEKIIISTNNETRGWAGAARIRKKLKQHFAESKIKTIFPVKKDWADSLNEKLIWKRKNLM